MAPPEPVGETDPSLETRVCAGLAGTIGRTPLIRLPALSAACGCEILGKAEFLNPGGSVKDRAALYLIRDAERRGALRPGGTVVEGTAGNTGIGLTHVCNALGYRCIVVIPETQSQEKMDYLRALGAALRPVPAKPYSDPGNFNHVAARLAESMQNAVWANQFDNTANRRAHYETTAPEIWAQTGGRIDAFVASVGTGGTLGGVSRYLKERRPDILTVLADPQGSGLYHYVKHGTVEVLGADSITEGIGNARITANLEGAPIDEAVQIDDQCCVDTLYRLLYEEGLLLGGSSAINVAATLKVAERLGPGHTLVTVLCDTGSRYLSRLYNPAWLHARGLKVPNPG